MSHSNYAQQCKRKFEAIETSLDKEQRQGSQRQRQKNKLETDDGYWFKNLTENHFDLAIEMKKYQYLVVSYPRGNKAKDGNKDYKEQIDRLGGLAVFRKNFQNHCPETYAETLNKTPLQRVMDQTIQHLKLYYLLKNPIFYMTGATSLKHETWILEFRLLPELWWSNSFEAVLTNIILGESSEVQTKIIQNLIGTKMSFFKDNDMDWTLKTDHSNSKILKKGTQVKGIDWTIFWAQLASYGVICSQIYKKYMNKEIRAAHVESSRKREEGQLMIFPLNPYLSTPHLAPYRYYQNFKKKQQIFIPIQYYPIDNEAKSVKLSLWNIFKFVGHQKDQWEVMKKQHSELRTSVLEYTEYLNFFQWFLSHKEVWKAAQQQKEEFSLLFLSFLIDF